MSHVHSGQPAETIFDTDLDGFEAAVIKASLSVPVIADFWAEWCPPCVALTPVLERVTSALDGRLKLAKIEVDDGDNMKLAGRYALKGFPTVLLFSGGEIKGRFSGARAGHWVKAFLAEHGVT
ncbi:MAG: thioredoxin [Gammaproteobacteria bacterium]|nr:thioredoxin [Rhodocyclaceae bacterium]MBU3909247.1 thioredoxin [Gammaproteobacteria bacterium]MBU3989645.1 thioredoxin [Gammaproteobacteria bacterium]MBU4005593.1 thioredoxin [Gammaproteobacteria bacterium]MBU4020854.1 thioredoxin [Gammaproteobacteria bacterium]